jgi:hypothetical protein
MEQKSTRGGARPNSGRPRKDPNIWGQITCVLRRDTIQKLKDGCGGASKHFGQFLQDHLDRYPLPSRETYLYRQSIKAVLADGRWGDPVRDKRLRELRRAEREQLKRERARARWEKRRAKMSPGQRALLDEVCKGLTNEAVAKQRRKEAKAAAAAKGAAKAA